MVMIAYWYMLYDKTWGVRVQGRPVVGANIVVRYKDAREPSHETVAEIVDERDDGTTVCRIKNSRRIR